MASGHTEYSPFNTCRHLHLATSHRRMVRSQEELAMRRPSGEKRQDLTGPEAESTWHCPACRVQTPPGAILTAPARFFD